MDVLRELTGLLLPVACAGCGRPDVAWCRDCGGLLGGVLRVEQRAGRWDRLDGPPAPVWACADYRGGVAAAVLVWKDRGRSDLDGPFAAAVRRLAAGPVRTALGGGPLVVVGVPSTRAALAGRGVDQVAVLTRAVRAGLARGGPASLARPLLRRGGPDLVGLGARARAAGLRGAVRVRRGRDVEGARVLLVDDVLTTGATLAACRTALEGAGATVVGAVTLASTPARGRTLGGGAGGLDGLPVAAVRTVPDDLTPSVVEAAAPAG